MKGRFTTLLATLACLAPLPASDPDELIRRALTAYATVDPPDAPDLFRRATAPRPGPEGGPPRGTAGLS